MLPQSSKSKQLARSKKYKEKQLLMKRQLKKLQRQQRKLVEKGRSQKQLNQLQQLQNQLNLLKRFKKHKIKLQIMVNQLHFSQVKKHLLQMLRNAMVNLLQNLKKEEEGRKKQLLLHLFKQRMIIQNYNQELPANMYIEKVAQKYLKKREIKEKKKTNQLQLNQNP